jgi:putative cell wall-binding protein
MKRIKKLITAAFLIMLIPFAFAAGQEKKDEQRIKIIVKDNGGSDVILDTLITGKPLSDSIVLKNGKTIFLAQEGGDIAGNEKCKHVNCMSSESGKTYSYTVESGTKVSDSEKTKYVISRDGIVVTVEGSDYARVKELIKEIEENLDTRSKGK